ncbi:MAG: 1-acyl-sn-glycerol-3-phosphate acyltransferase [Acidobacteria bacterium]|nr:1-acyl-sn-glycerol-3-phosphate acyltransferase [Acidobacteriota bacterium]
MARDYPKQKTRSDMSRRVLQRAAGLAEGLEGLAAKPVKMWRTKGFPYRAPSVPRGVEVPTKESTLGANFDTDFARGPGSRFVRRLLVAGPVNAMVQFLARPTVEGVDRLTDLANNESIGGVIFAPNHHSHLDTPLMVTAVPKPWRDRLVVAAAADYFFDKRVKGTLAALALNAIPIDRETTSRKSSDELRHLLARDWSLVIYPEGGRSPDGWGQEFKAGAAYLSAKTGAPVVPVFIDGTGAIFGKGMKRPKRGHTRVVFGAPLFPDDGENTRRFSDRIERAVTLLGDESSTDFWTARRRAAQGSSTPLTGPDYTGWRRQWALYEHRKTGVAGQRRRQKRRWPNLD